MTLTKMLLANGYTYLRGPCGSHIVKGGDDTSIFDTDDTVWELAEGVGRIGEDKIMACREMNDCCRGQDCNGSLLRCKYTNIAERLPQVVAALAQRESEA